MRVYSEITRACLHSILELMLVEELCGDNMAVWRQHNPVATAMQR